MPADKQSTRQEATGSTPDTGPVQFEWNERDAMTDATKDTKYILEVKDLKQYFPIYRGFFQRVVGYTKAVDGISFSLVDQEVLGVVGESGCGKTTTGRSILRLYEPTGGEVWYRRENGSRVNVAWREQAGDEGTAARDAHDLSGPVQFAQSAPDGEGPDRRAVDYPQGGARQGVGSASCRADAQRGAGPELHEPLPA